MSSIVPTPSVAPRVVSPSGLLAWEFCRKRLSLQVLCSRAGFHIGTADEAGPCSRESLKYFPTVELAEEALARGTWTQRQEP